MTRWASFIVLVVIILVIGAAFFRILSTFLVPLFLAAILVVIVHPIHQRIVERVRRRRVAALLTTGLVLLVVLVPSLVVISLAIVEGVSLTAHGELQDVPRRLRDLRRRLHLEMPWESEIRRLDSQFDAILESLRRGQLSDPKVIAEAKRRLLRLHDVVEAANESASLSDARTRLQEAADHLNAIHADQEFFEQEDAVLEAYRGYQDFKTAACGGSLRRFLIELANPDEGQRMAWRDQVLDLFQRYVLPVGGAAAAMLLRILVGAAILVISLYFFLVDGPKMIETVMRLSPLDDRYERELIAEFAGVSRSVVLATLVSACVQGLLAGIGFWVCGLHSVFFLMLLTILFAMIPFVGAATVWIPATLWLYFVEERATAAILLALYGGLIVSMIDNLIKPWILHGQSRLHPLLALLSVLGGVQALGPIGILVGPMIVVCLQVLLSLLQRELAQLDQRRPASEPS